MEGGAEMPQEKSCCQSAALHRLVTILCSPEIQSPCFRVSDPSPSGWFDQTRSSSIFYPSNDGITRGKKFPFALAHRHRCPSPSLSPTQPADQLLLLIFS